MSSTDQDIATRTDTNAVGLLGSMDDADIEALVFLVLMQAAKSAQEDLKALMAQVKHINSQKQKLRQLLSEAAEKLLFSRRKLSEEQLRTLVVYLMKRC